jgi:hypothetical protein
LLNWARMTTARPTITIESRYRGPKHSSNGGYVCGRVARFIEGPSRVRLHIPPPLDVRFDVHDTEEGVRVTYDDVTVAEAWPAEFDLEVPSPPNWDEAELASKGFVGFKSHRFVTCFVCGVGRDPGDGMRVFAGPVAGRDLVACTWTPEAQLSDDGQQVNPVFVWSVLDCPGGFSFPHPATGTILLGEFAVKLIEPVTVGEPHVVIGWELGREGRKHYTGTALFSDSGTCHGLGKAIWFEVPDLENS